MIAGPYVPSRAAVPSSIFRSPSTCARQVVVHEALTSPASVEVGTMALDRKVSGNRTITVKGGDRARAEKVSPGRGKIRAMTQAQPPGRWRQFPTTVGRR